MDTIGLAEKLLFTTIKIESHDSNNNVCFGTGFFFSYVTRVGSEITSTDFIVTNRHVVENGITGELSFIKRDLGNKPLLGDRLIFKFTEKFSKRWYFNENRSIDIAILPVTDLFLYFAYTGKPIFYMPISNENMLNEASLKEIDALEEIVFVGYPYGLWDEKNFLPVFRKGITASPITVDFNGEKKFLIDASVYEGSSGSPVFLFNKGQYSPKTGGIKMGTRLSFLGILSKGYDIPVIGEMDSIVERETKTMKSKERKVEYPLSEQALDIGVVINASAIVDTIAAFFPHFQDWRKENLGVNY